MLHVLPPLPAANVVTMRINWCLVALRPRISLNRILVALAFLLVPAVCLGQTPEPVETIRVESDLVDLKVSVLSLNPQNPSPDLQQRDFLVLEDGKPQNPFGNRRTLSLKIIRPAEELPSDGLTFSPLIMSEMMAMGVTAAEQLFRA